MGLLEQLAAGHQFRRTTTTITGAGGVSTGQVSTGLGGSYILLTASSTKTCRVRLYPDSSSLVIDEPRSLTNFNVSASVGLTADIYLTGSAPSLTFNPPIIGTRYNGNVVWYTVSGSVGAFTVTLTTYPIAALDDDAIDRSSIDIQRASVPSTGNGVSGSVTTDKSFLILSASSTYQPARLRLYSTSHTEIPSGEVTRSFGTASSAGANLIADMMFDSASYGYRLTPVLEGYTYQGTNYYTGTNTLGYILQNMSGAATTISASLYVYATED